MLFMTPPMREFDLHIIRLITYFYKKNSEVYGSTELLLLSLVGNVV